jgi:hypothetical protein
MYLYGIKTKILWTKKPKNVRKAAMQTMLQAVVAFMD